MFEQYFWSSNIFQKCYNSFLRNVGFVNIFLSTFFKMLDNNFSTFFTLFLPHHRRSGARPAAAELGSVRGDGLPSPGHTIGCATTGTGAGRRS
jgi:hypothetical protein